MKTRMVRDLMVPLQEYATVNEEASLYAAVLALEEAQKTFTRTATNTERYLSSTRAGVWWAKSVNLTC